MKIKVLLLTVLTSMIAGSAFARNESINSALDITLGETTESSSAPQAQGKTVLVIENAGDYTGIREEIISNDASNDLERDLATSTTTQLSNKSDPAL